MPKTNNNSINRKLIRSNETKHYGDTKSGIYFFLKYLSGPESQILESDWLNPRGPAVLIFLSGPRVRTVSEFSRIVAILAAFCNTQNLHEM